MPVLRLFLDANVLFVAGYSRTNPVHDLLALGRAGACELVASGYALEEARPSAMEVAASAALADSADVPILAAAIQCRADVLVTGDRRAFGRHFRTRLVGVEVLVLRDALRRVLGLPLGDRVL